MRRRLVKQGLATYTISLPKEWVNRFNLKAGEEIDLEETGAHLIISAIQKEKKYETLEYDLTDLPTSLSKEFAVSLYKYGIKNAKLINYNKEQASLVKEVTNSTIGLEIISQDKEKLEILDLGTSNEESLIKAKQQIFWRLLHLVDRISDKKSKNDEIREIDKEINKLTFFIQRNLATKYSNRPDNFLFYEEVSTLESLGDSLRSLKMYSNWIDENFLILLSNFLDFLKSSNKNIEKFKEIRTNLDNLKDLAEKKQKKDNSSLAYILIYKNVKQIFDIEFTLSIKIFESRGKNE